MPYETFDIDLLEGKAAEGAFSRVLCSARFEHKLDKKAARTGNIAVEYETRKRNGEVILSGIAITTAEWWVVEFAPSCRLILPVEHAKKITRIAIKAGLDRWIGDGNNHHNALIPFAWFLEKGCEFSAEKEDAA